MYKTQSSKTLVQGPFNYYCLPFTPFKWLPVHDQPEKFITVPTPAAQPQSAAASQVSISGDEQNQSKKL